MLQSPCVRADVRFVSSLSSLLCGSLSVCFLFLQRHGSDEEAGLRWHQDELPRRPAGPAGVSATGDPHQPGVGPRLGGTSHNTHTCSLFRRSHQETRPSSFYSGVGWTWRRKSEQRLLLCSAWRCPSSTPRWRASPSTRTA